MTAELSFWALIAAHQTAQQLRIAAEADHAEAARKLALRRKEEDDARRAVEACVRPEAIRPDPTQAVRPAVPSTGGPADTPTRPAASAPAAGNSAGGAPAAPPCDPEPKPRRPRKAKAEETVPLACPRCGRRYVVPLRIAASSVCCCSTDLVPDDGTTTLPPEPPPDVGTIACPDREDAPEGMLFAPETPTAAGEGA